MMRRWLVRFWKWLWRRENCGSELSGEKPASVVRALPEPQPPEKEARPSVGSGKKSSSFSLRKKPEREGAGERVPKKPPERSAPPVERIRTKTRTDGRPERKRKIPVLDKEADLFVLMGGDPEKEGPAQEPDLPEPEILGEQEAERRSMAWPVPEKTLDLHGLNTLQAEVRIRSAVLTARMDGTEVLRIVTGKGLHSRSGTAILRDYTEDFLVELQRLGEIRAFRWEGKTKRKSGAVWVRMRHAAT